MGWLSKSGKGRKQRKRRSAPGLARHPLGQAVIQQRKHLAVAAMLMVVLAGWYYARGYLFERAATATAAPTAGHVKLTDAPAWLGKLVRQDLREQVSACPSMRGS